MGEWVRARTVGWDWTFVGELAVGLAVGIGIGGWFFADRIEKAGLRIAGHPSVRKMANAADHFTQGAQGQVGWPGLIASGLNWLTGGRFLQGGQQQQLALPPGKGVTKAYITDTDGNILGETTISSGR